MVSPLRSNSRLLTTSTRTPASVSRAKAVGCGCHSSGSTALSQNSALSSRSVPGTRLVNPTRPCVPGVSPVPSEVRLVAVVDGTPAVPGAESASSEERYGAVAAYRSQQPRPEPVDEEQDVRRRLGQHQARSGAAQDVAAERTADRRHDVTEPAMAVRGLDERAVGPVTPRASVPRAARRRTAGAATASWPSAAAETRSEKSSEASTPV